VNRIGGREFYRALIRPKNVALVGASDAQGKVAARPQTYLAQRNWAGSVYLVNPRHETVAGQRCWRSVQDLPKCPDHVFILTGSDAAVDAVAHCVERGVPVVSVLADGFVGTEPAAAARRDRLRETLDGSNTRLLGPSTLGVATLTDGLMLTANAAFADPALRRGGVFVAAQSGSAIGALASRGAELGIGFHALVSTGNEFDLSVGEICRAAVDDPQVLSFALFLENITHVGHLRDFAVAAAERGKPVLAYKIGRSEAAARLSVSHTGALAGDDAVADALLAELGIGRVDIFEALLEGQHLARAARPLTNSAAPRVCVLSTTGGGGAMAVDCLAQVGAEMRGPTRQTVDRLATLGVTAGDGALIDLTLAGTQYEVMRGALEVVLAAPEFDAVVAVPGSSARFHPELTVKPIAEFAGATKPLAAFIVPAAVEAQRLLQEAGISAFRTPESCAAAVAAACARQRPLVRPAPPVMPAGEVELLDEASSYPVLESLGIRCAAYAVVDVTALPSELPVPGPAAVKLLSSSVAHKSDLGAVVLDVADGAALASAVATIGDGVARAAPDIAVGRVLVQSMVRGRGEALIGFRRDPEAGPVVVLAAGGVLAELYRDRAVRMAPVDEATARAMVAQIVGFRPLAGYRGAPTGDLEALAGAVVAMSLLADTAPEVVEAELNPVIVGSRGEGVCAVDAVVHRIRRTRT
jgi:acetate---CoA ligase (ADP-forming)